MDFCRNVTASKLTAAAASNSPLDDLFSAQNTEVDFSMEWLSVFVEDCLSSTGICLPAPTSDSQKTNTEENPPKPSQQKPQDQENPSSSKKSVIPGRARSKRRRINGDRSRNPLTSWCYTNQALNLPFSDPPLLQQTHWLADSELIMPVRDGEVQEKSGVEDDGEDDDGKETSGRLGSHNDQQQPRRCTHCLAQRTPQWRAGPLGPKTLCNACGVRFKSGRLLPEYRPAKSPTFVSYLHSNSHKKVMEMRMNSN
ncbi:hypothetical protein DKX38_029178 [Salix brachista]|uniref:GATA-type domain-containing protein n=1 Tax=Salix brachista TaxID=2182728 RepID=A0A5N5J217_9ROSI|nr:hypothetical protein DKX38_029178 [Salix brachista]